MEIPTTINHSFNHAVKYLLEFHPVFYLMGPALNMGKRPKGLRSDKSWQFYLSQIAEVLIVGKRNKWVSIHVNRRGCPVYWLFHIPSHCIKKDSKPIWTNANDH